MPYETPPGPPIQLAIYGETAPAHAECEQQTVQTWYARMFVDGSVNPEVQSPLILAGGCTQLVFTVVAFTTFSPGGSVSVFGLPVGWTGPNAGAFWVDPAFLYYYLSLGSVSFVIGNQFSYGAFFTSVPASRPHGMFALRFTPDDQYPWTLTLDVVGSVARSE